MSICIKNIYFTYIYFTYIYIYTKVYTYIYTYRDEREERLEGVELTRILTQGGGEACRLKAWVPLFFHVFLFPRDERIKLL